MASPRLTPVRKPLAPPNPAPPERVTTVLPRSLSTATTALPRRRSRHPSLFRGRISMRAAAAADREPRSPRVNCAGQVRTAADRGLPDYACFCIPASTATSKRPFTWRSLFPFRSGRRRQVSEETTAAAAMVVENERARYLVRPPGEASTLSPPANALLLMRCSSVYPKSKLPRAMAGRRDWKGSRVVPDMTKETTSQVHDVCDGQDGPGCSSSLCMGCEEDVDEEEVPAPEKKVEELIGL